MTTLKLIFKMADNKGREGTLVFLVSHRHTVRRVSTKCRIFADEWDERNNCMLLMSPMSAGRNKTLTAIHHKVCDIRQRLNGIISKYDSAGLPYNTADIIYCYHHLPASAHNSVSGFIQRLIGSLRQQGRLRTADSYRQLLNSIMTFRNGSDLYFGMINATFAESYESWLRSRRLCRNTTSFYMRILRSVYNKAVAEGIAPKGEPFATVYTGVDKTSHRAVSMAAIRRVKALNLSGDKSLAFARDIFLFSFYMRGMSFVDIAYLRKKTCATATSSTAARRRASSSPSDGNAPCRPSSTPTVPRPRSISCPSSRAKTAPSAPSISTPCSVSTATSRRLVPLPAYPRLLPCMWRATRGLRLPKRETSPWASSAKPWATTPKHHADIPRVHTDWQD